MSFPDERDALEDRNQYAIYRGVLTRNVSA
jgi:hypothetical protein